MFQQIPRSASDRIVRTVLGYEANSRGAVHKKRDYPIPQQAPGKPFRNDSGETVPAYAIMAVTDIEVDGDDWFFTIAKPSTTFRRFYVANDSTAIENGKKGQCFDGSDGPVKVLYDATYPDPGEPYGPKPGQWSLSKFHPETSIALGVFDTDNKIMVANLHPINVVIGKLASALDYNEAAYINIWAGDAYSESVVTDLVLTGYNWLMKSGDDAIETGAKVVVTWINGIPYVTEAECA